MPSMYKKKEKMYTSIKISIISTKFLSKRIEPKKNTGPGSRSVNFIKTQNKIPKIPMAILLQNNPQDSQGDKRDQLHHLLIIQDTLPSP